MDLDSVLASWRADPDFMRDVAAWQHAPATHARVADWPPVHARVRESFARQGITQPYSHQAEGLTLALGGQNVVVAAGTAGGKSMVYQAAILNALLQQPRSTALCLFPTKALSQDQQMHLRALMDPLGPGESKTSLVQTYDGDTPQSARAELRRDARVIISNADMLHMGILPHHTRWAGFFRQLRFVVIDELHTYRGIFGSHVANVLRRLRRICAFYGSNPVFIMASATIANPQEHAQRLLELPVALVDDDGSPHGAQHVIVVNPPILPDAAASGLRRSALLVARDVAARSIAAGAQTITFARSRADTEVLLSYLQSRYQKQAGFPPPAVQGEGNRQQNKQQPSVAGYRGGYLPEERRAIEADLRSGALRGVVATNALELGIDIGALDVCVMCGYPGSIASFWQQGGRAGRRQTTSAAVMVASGNPLDQYLAAHPEYLFSQNPEHARIAPDNLGILSAHSACAAFELPFHDGEKLGSADVEPLLKLMVEDGVLHASDAALPLFGEVGAAPTDSPSRRYTWIGENYPAENVSLRGIGDRISIMCEGTLIGETERSSAALRVHVGAVYMHQAATYLITSLDWETGMAHARRVDSEYYTRASAATEVVVLEVFDAATIGSALVATGELEITSRPTRYRQIQFNTHRELGFGDIDAPDQTLLTTGYWFAVPQELAKQLVREGVLKLPNDYGPNWQQQRNLARQRDGFKCTVCGAVEVSGQQHDVHHKVPFRAFGYLAGDNDRYLQANEINNLMTVCRNCHAKVETAERADTALEGLAYLLGNIAPLFVMCDPADIAVVADWHSPHTKLPTITAYELAPGGTGLAEALRARHDALLNLCRQRVAECMCARGCPACIGPIIEDERMAKRNLKQDVIRLVDALEHNS